MDNTILSFDDDDDYDDDHSATILYPSQVW